MTIKIGFIIKCLTTGSMSTVNYNLEDIWYHKAFIRDIRSRIELLFFIRIMETPRFQIIHENIHRLENGELKFVIDKSIKP